MSILRHTHCGGLGVEMERRRETRIWAIASGKGGIGKSFVAANLGMALCERGKKVILIDADLSGSNLYAFLGIARPTVGLDDFIRGGVRNLKGVLVETGIPNLRFVAGICNQPAVMDQRVGQRQRIIHQLQSLEADHIIVDLGPGISFYNFDLFLSSDNGIFLSTPEATCLENTYRLIRGVFFYRLKKVSTNKRAQGLIECAMYADNREGIRVTFDLLARIEEFDRGEADTLRESIASFQPRLIVNQTRNRKEAEVGFAVRSACRKYFGFDLCYLGQIVYDYNAYSSLQWGRAFFADYPSSELAACIRGIAARISDGTGLGWRLE